MGICKRTNLTIIIKIVKHLKGIIDIEGDRVTGSIGKDIDALLDKVPDRQCKLIGAYNFGKELSNGSYNGALQLLYEKKGDIYLAHGTQFFIKDWLWSSQAIYSDKHVVSHTINQNSIAKEVNIISQLCELNQLKLYLVLFTLIFLLMIISITSYMCNESNLGHSKFKIKIRLIMLNLMKFKLNFKYPFTLIGLILIFYNLFFMLFKLMIINNIKTSKVVVQTNDLIGSLDQLLEKKDMVVCWLKDDMEISLAIESPQVSLIRRIYEEKKFRKLTKNMDGDYSYDCVISFTNNGELIDLDHKVLFIDKASHYAFLAFFINYKPNTKVWFNENGRFTETVSVYHMRRGLSQFQRNAIDINNIQRLEAGLSMKDYNKIVDNLKRAVDQRVKLYTNLHQYIDDNTIFTNLDYDYFRTLFILKISFESILIIIFGLYLVFKKIRSKKLAKNLINNIRKSSKLFTMPDSMN